MQQTQENRDPELWELAKRRASFKSHLATYVLVNGFLWILWAINGSKDGYSGIPWPIWSTLGWGIGILSHYWSAYVFPKGNGVQREYDKLKAQQHK